VLVVGAGEVGTLAVTRLAETGAAGISVWNRSPVKADRLASKVGARVVPVDGLAAAVAAADVVVCTTGAPEPVLDAPAGGGRSAATHRRRGRAEARDPRPRRAAQRRAGLRGAARRHHRRHRRRP
jgi:glutamyl-tRNA reductase